MPITLGNTTITGLGVGGLPSGTVNADSLASTLDISGKTVTLPNAIQGSLIEIADTGLLTSGNAIIIDNCFSTSYQHYLVEVYAIGNTDENTRWAFNLRTGGASGSDFSSNYRWRRYRHYTGHTVNEIDSSGNDSSVELNFYNRSNSGIMARFNIYTPHNTTFNTYYDGYLHGFHPGGDTNSFAHDFTGAMNTATVFTGIRFFGRSSWTGSFTNARMIVYGFRGYN
jgi:hypothetical protein